MVVPPVLTCLNPRLKITLNLPPIEPRPPVPPRIYKRLYTYLDKTLPATSLAGRPRANGSGTPRSKGLSSPASRPMPSRGTPTKDVSLSQFRNPSTPSKLNTQHSAARPKTSAVPPWILPTVRHLFVSLVAEEGGRDLVPTVMAGLESIIAPYRQRTDDEWVNGHLTPLVGAIYWYVSESARLAPGEEMTAEKSAAGYKSVRKEMLVALRGARRQVDIPVTLTRGKTSRVTEEDETMFWDGWQEGVKAADLDEAVTEVMKRGWLNSDWYRSIEFLRDKAGDAGNGDVKNQDPADTVGTVQITKADTMLQDKFDYLNERRRTEYRHWKAGILRQVELLERGQDKAENSMDVDSV